MRTSRGHLRHAKTRTAEELVWITAKARLITARGEKIGHGCSPTALAGIRLLGGLRSCRVDSRQYRRNVTSTLTLTVTGFPSGSRAGLSFHFFTALIAFSSKPRQ